MVTPSPLRFSTTRRLVREASSLLVATALVLVARSSLADHYHVPSGSMQPTVDVGDHVLVNKLAYGLRLPMTHRYLVEAAGPQRGDVVVLDSPETDVVLLKRVVATPGDLVEVRQGKLSINGAAVPVEQEHAGLVEQLGAHRHPVNLDDGGGPDLGPLTLPEGRYLVMGDNRGNSHDGRMFGLVDRSSILGRGVLVQHRVTDLRGL
jgi:signal peptidase I